MRTAESMRGRCLKPLAAAAGKMREAGESFNKTVASVRKLAEPLKFQKDAVHIALYSAAAVTALVGYEYLSATAREYGINMPSALQLVGMLPVASASGDGGGGGNTEPSPDAVARFEEIMQPGSNGNQR